MKYSIIKNIFCGLVFGLLLSGCSFEQTVDVTEIPISTDEPITIVEPTAIIEPTNAINQAPSGL